jgi:hypothetical protein
VGLEVEVEGGDEGDARKGEGARGDDDEGETGEEVDEEEWGGRGRKADGCMVFASVE